MLGGTFDPPHLAHLVLAAAARHALRLDRVLFVPAGEPWRKAHREIAPAHARVRMVEAAVEPLRWTEVSTIEVDRPGPSYSEETLTELARGGGDWWFIVGGDALADMSQWHEPAALIAVARLAVARRPPAAVEVPQELRRLVAGIDDRIDEVPMPPLDISATAMRGRVRDGWATEVLLPTGTRRVIDELGLYRGVAG